MKKPWQEVRFIVGAIVLLGAALAALVRQGFVVAAQPAGAASGESAVQTKPGATAAKIGNEADEKAIRATADDFVKAFNAADVKAVGALWATDAEYTDESGQSYQGRAAIEKEYADGFKEHPGATMTVTIESIRFLGPDIAVEKGIAKVKSPGADVARRTLHRGPRQARRQVDHGCRAGRPLRAGIERGLPQGPRVADRRLDARSQRPPVEAPFRMDGAKELHQEHLHGHARTASRC